MKRALNFVYPLVAAAIFIIFVCDATSYMTIFVNGISVWANNVLPAVFPFAVLFTLVASKLQSGKRSLTAKLFNCDSDIVYLCSLTCGYPIGAKLIAESSADSTAATKASSFCSSPTPIFLIATIGAKMLNSAKATIVLLVANVLATVANGLTYRSTDAKRVNFCEKQTPFGEIVASCMAASLTVGGLIALFFMLSAMIKSFLPTSVADSAVVGFLFGLLEMTNGVISVCATCDVKVATVLCCALTSFGGLCILAQSFAFLSAKKVKLRSLIVQKVTQCAYCTIFGLVLSSLIL